MQAVDAASHVRFNRRLGSAIKPREISIHRSYYSQFPPTGVIPAAGGQLYYAIPANGGAFIDLRNSFIEVVGTLANLASADTFGFGNECPKNGFGDLLFNSWQVQIAGEACNDLTNSYAGVASFMRRALVKPQGWGGGNQHRLVSTGSTLGKPIALGAVSFGGLGGGAGAADINANLNSIDFSTQGGRGDSMFYYFGHAVTQSQDFIVNAVVPCNTYLYVDCEAQMQTAFNSTKQQRVARTIVNGVQDLFNAAGVPNAAGALAARQFSSYCWPTGLATSLDMFLPTNTPVNFQLTRSPDSLVLESNGGTPTLTLTACRLWLRYVEPTQSCLQQYQAILAETGISISYVRSFLAPVTISAGTNTVNASGLLAGARPDYVVIAMATTQSLIGSYTQPALAMAAAAYPINVPTASYVSPFSQLTITWAGVQYPQIVIAADSDNYTGVNLGLCQMRAYEQYAAMCLKGDSEDASPLLSYAAWASNYTLYCIDLRGSTTDEAGQPGTVSHDDPGASGSLSIVGTLAIAPTVSLTALVLGIGSGQLYFNSTGNCQRVGF